jgi:inosine/xanthosine triphosphate pyrophosphatase family protein
MDPERKNAVSHRGKALRLFREKFARILERPAS